MGQKGRRRVPWCERGFGMELGGSPRMRSRSTRQTKSAFFAIEAGLARQGDFRCSCLNAAFLLQTTKIHQTLEYRHCRIRKRGLESPLLRSEASSVIGKRLHRAIRTEPDLRNRLHLHTPQHGPGAKTASFQSTTQPLCHRSNNIQDVGAARDRQGTGTAS
jgi:hypothetical protein